MAYLWADSTKMAKGQIYITCPKFGGNSIETIAESIKERFDKYPEVARYSNMSPLTTA